MATAHAATWRCAHRLDEVLRAWEGEQHAVYFDPASGDTHLIDALGAQLAEWLADHPLTREQLLYRLAHDVDWDETPSPDALADLLDLHLRRLVDINLLDVRAAQPVEAPLVEEPVA